MLDPSRFEGWTTFVEESEAIGTPMPLSDLPVHREQALGARLFGVEDAAALADAIAPSPVRTTAQLAQAGREARERNVESQREFANSLSDAVRRALP